jgi:bifunctional DNA-binding transcriptional regulator/antitoxin component of YhaV-PrlF toxin-antitoxin module
MSITVKIGARYNITIPKILIEKMKFAKNDELLVDIEDNRLVLIKKPCGYTAKLRGLYKKVWNDVDASDYVKSERESWE